MRKSGIDWKEPCLTGHPGQDEASLFRIADVAKSKTGRFP